jgi:hypothetical protein
VTLFDIMVTGNHYWIDGPGGLVFLGVGYVIARLLTSWWESRRGAIAPTPAPAPVATAAADSLARP